MVSKAIAAAAALAMGGVVAAQAAAAVHHPAHPARGAHRTSSHPSAVGQPRVACTVLGCIQIPPACEPVAGRTLGGRPTGYDVIVCPPGIWPLK